VRCLLLLGAAAEFSRAVLAVRHASYLAVSYSVGCMSRGLQFGISQIPRSLCFLCSEERLLEC
jgi:hypothetical protein